MHFLQVMDYGHLFVCLDVIKSLIFSAGSSNFKGAIELKM